MIVSIEARGSSFKGLATYLTHDPKKETDERVGFLHTRNLANDNNVSGVVHEMYLTAEYAEELKEAAGIRAGGRESDRPVKHVSLNWAPDEEITREQMVQAADGYLVHMGWDEHQALIVSHTDKHPHVHIMLNMVHPETGLILDESFDRRRSQAWALEYERENGQIRCEQRLLNAEEREASPTRPAWMALKEKQKEFEAAEKTMRAGEELAPANENSKNSAEYSYWKKLKEIQREERDYFWAEGKIEFNDLRKSLLKEVREDFQEKWADYYQLRRDGGDPDELKRIKAELVAEQKAALDSRCEGPFGELREARNVAYRELLDGQQDIRKEFKAHREAGLDAGLFFDQLDNRGRMSGVVTAEEADNRERPVAPENAITSSSIEAEDFPGRTAAGGSGLKSEGSIAAGIGEGLGVSVISLFESVADGMMGATPAPKPRQPEPAEHNPFLSANDNAPKAKEPSREDDEDWYQRQRSRGD